MNRAKQVIPLAAAVLCESCQCITASTGHRCDCCGSTAPYSVQRMLEKFAESRQPKPLTGIDKHYAEEADIYMNALEAEVAELKARLATKWIDCKQEMPPDVKAVIVWCPERMNKYTACWRGGAWMHFGGPAWNLTEEVTHWTPTPTPPEATQ